MIDDVDLKKIEFFEDLTGMELNSVKSICREEQYKKGDMVFSENSPAKHLYVVKKGRVAIEIKVSEEKDVNVYTVSHDGEAFGWSALVEPFKFSAGARCVEDSTIISIDVRKLKDLINQDYHLGYIIMGKVSKIISNRLRNTRLQLINVAYG